MAKTDDKAAGRVLFVPKAPRYKFTDLDKVELRLPTNPDRAAAAITLFLLKQAVASKYPQGMELKDGRQWGKIVDALLDDDGEVVQEAMLTRGQFDWLCDVLNGARFGSGAMQWADALDTYIDGLKLELKVKLEEGREELR